MDNKISLVVPCYNEQEALPVFYTETTKVLKEIGCAYEYIFVNDGSADDTLSILKQLAAQDEHITYLSLSRNFGKEAAMYAGFCNVDMLDGARDFRLMKKQMVDAIVEMSEYNRFSKGIFGWVGFRKLWHGVGDTLQK